MIATQQNTATSGVKAETTNQLESEEHKEKSYTYNKTITTVIRFSMRERLIFLDEALFSLAIQFWPELETVIVVQNGDDELARKIEELIKQQPWPAPPRYKICSVKIPDGVDGRSALLNRGIKEAGGRFLAFLDDDDVVYQHGYATLIQQLMSGGHAIAVGGCRRAKIAHETDHWFVRVKDNPFAWGKSKYDLFRTNFVPIHSYVIDRSRIGEFELYVDESLSKHEDYDFLIRFCATFEPDFAKLDTPVCEYRIRQDGSNTVLDGHAGLSPELHAAWEESERFVDKRKKALLAKISVSELVELKEGLLKFEEQTLAMQQQSLVLQQQLRVYQQEKILEQNRFLNTVARKTYTFFSHYPWLEKQLSDFAHAGWRVVKRMKGELKQSN